MSTLGSWLEEGRREGRQAGLNLDYNLAGGGSRMHKLQSFELPCLTSFSCNLLLSSPENRTHPSDEAAASREALGCVEQNGYIGTRHINECCHNIVTLTQRLAGECLDYIELPISTRLFAVSEVFFVGTAAIGA